MKTKKIISLLLAVVMIAGVLPMSALALSTNDVATIIDATEDVVKTISKLSTEEIDAADLIKTTAEQFVTEEAVDVIKEVLDNGTDVFIVGTDLKAVAEKLGIKLVESDDEDLLFGGYISAYNGKYSLTQLCAYLDSEDAADPVVANKFKSADFEKYVDYEQLIADNTKSEAAAADAGDSSVAKLQTDSRTPLLSGVKILYWFKEGEPSGTNTNFCLKNGNNVRGEIEGWSKIATLSMSMKVYYYACDRSGYYTYTNCTFKVSPTDEKNNSQEKAVVEYICLMDLEGTNADVGNGNGTSTLVDYTKLSAENGKVHVSYVNHNIPVDIPGNHNVTLSFDLLYESNQYYYVQKDYQELSEAVDGYDKVNWKAIVWENDPNKNKGVEYFIKPGIFTYTKKNNDLYVSFGFKKVELQGFTGYKYTISANNPQAGIYVDWENVKPYI